MAANHADRMIALGRAFGTPAAPDQLIQEAFEGNDRHLRRLLRVKPGERPDPQDLWEYLQDLRYTEIQSSLLGSTRARLSRFEGKAIPLDPSGYGLRSAAA